MGSEEILEEKSEKYFNYLTTYSNDNIKSFETSSENLREKVSLRISITNIKKDYNYSLQIFSINHQNIPIPFKFPRRINQTIFIRSNIKNKYNNGLLF